MSRHPAVQKVDELVADLDAATIDEPIDLPATSSYAVIADEWDRFKTLVRDLDVAVGAPLSLGAPKLFERAPELVDHRAHKLAFWLEHVGEAIFRHLPPVDGSRET